MKADHNILAPSAAWRWVNCGASVPLERQRPDVEDSQVAKEGNAAHHVAAEYLRQEQNNPPTKWHATAGDATPNGIIVTEEMIEAVDLFVEEILDRVGDATGKLHIEEYQPIPHIHTDNGGTPDVWWAAVAPGAGAYLYIPDFKYGHKFVDAFENWQLIDYAFGILGRDEFANIPQDRIEIEFIIVQPRSYDPAGPVRTWKITAAALYAGYFERLRAAAINARSNDPTAVVGPWCRDCEARGGCRALQQAADIAMDYAQSAMLQDLPPPALSVELRFAERALALLEARVAGMQEQAMAHIKGNTFVPGYEIERKDAREQWSKDPVEVFTLGDLMGVNLRQDPKPITPNQARRAGVPDNVVAGFSFRPQGKMVLKPTNTDITRRIFSK